MSFWSCCCPGGVVTCAQICFVLKGCNNLPLSGASVVVKLGATTVASGTTDEFGMFATSALGDGTYNWTITSTGFDDETGSVAIACPDTDKTVSRTLTVATGYVCWCRGTCASPVTTGDKVLTDSLLGTTVILTYNAGTGVWSGTTTYDWPGCGEGVFACPAANGITLVYEICVINELTGNAETRLTWEVNEFVDLQCCPSNGLDTCTFPFASDPGDPVATYECDPFVEVAPSLIGTGASGSMSPYHRANGPLGTCVANPTVLTITDAP